MFGGNSHEIVLENMSTTSLGSISIVTIGVDKQESSQVPIAIPKPPEKAEILKAVHGKSNISRLPLLFSGTVCSTMVQTVCRHSLCVCWPGPISHFPTEISPSSTPAHFPTEMIPSSTPAHFPTEIIPSSTPAQSTSVDTSSQYVVALYPYSPEEDSPNEFPELELSFTEGDIIKVFIPD